MFGREKSLNATLPVRIARCLGLLSALLAVPLPADVIVLKSGGRVEGELADPTAGRRSLYRLNLPSGGHVTFRRSDVARIERDAPHEAEYGRRARQAADTVAEHERLAEWCREHRLVDAYRTHLERVVELDPHHETARRQLGYQRHHDRWVSREDLMEARGLVLYDGKYRTRQEITLLEQNDKRRFARAEWSDRLRRWFRRLGDRDPQRAAEARQALQEVRDPAAAGALVELLAEARDFDTRLMLIEVASRIPSAATRDALIRLSLEDPRDEIRAQCLEYLTQSYGPGLAGRYVRALGSANNEMVNRAGYALQVIGDPDVIGPLIDALVTEHRFVRGGGTQGNHAYAMSGDGSFSFGGSAPQVQRRQLRNPDVLSALVRLAGGISFAYDQAAWRGWLAAQSKLVQVDMRRDE